MEPKAQKNPVDTSLEQCLRKKLEIEQAIQKRFQRSISVMFTDISASTTFFEALGDIRGRSVIQQHNDLLKPVIRRHGGRIIKHLGDGLLICFDSPVAATRAAIETQDTIETANFYKQSQERIHIKIGLHHGVGIVEQNDVYGDVVNTASRFCSVARESEILASQALIDAIGNQEEIRFDYAGTRKFKGKAIPIRTYRIIWNQKRTSRVIPPPESEAFAGESHTGTLRLSFGLSGGQITLQAESIHESDEPVLLHVQYPFHERLLRELVQDFDEHLTKVDEHGRSSKSNLAQIRQLGEQLYGALIPPELDQFISKIKPRNLLLEIAQSLSYIPWELLHDDESFLCLKYAMGKVVSTNGQSKADFQPVRCPPIRMLVITDPRGSLPAAKHEAAVIQNVIKLEGNGLIVDVRSAEVTCEFFKDNFAQYDILHYAGHSKSDPYDPSTSALLLADSDFEVASLLQLTNKGFVPSLIFANACQTSLRKNWLSEEKLYGFASGFLHSGVRHYIGSTLDLYDRSSSYFAEDFYKHILRGSTVGEALQSARLESISRYGEELLTWSSYSLFGDPNVRYFAAKEGGPDTTQRDRARTFRSRSMVFIVLVLIIAVAALVGKSWLTQNNQRNLTDDIFAMMHSNKANEVEHLISSLQHDSPGYLQALAGVYLFRGDLDKVEALLSLAQNDETVRDHLIVTQGHLALAKGDFERSRIFYQQALQAGGLDTWQKAECHYGLGRVFLLQGSIDQAEAEFDLALAADPSFVQAHVAKGIALEHLGKNEKALEHFKRANTINSSDQLSNVMYQRSLERLEYSQRAEKKARVATLIADLAKEYREGGGRKSAKALEWKSKPLYFFSSGFESKGTPALIEGEDALIEEQVVRAIAASSRLHLVDRPLLDILLGELRLSNSELSDPDTLLQLGRILSARILVSGSIIRYRGQLQVSLKAIDIETTRIVASASGTTKISQQPMEMLKDLTDDLLQKVVSDYPIRGLITDIKERTARLNVGKSLGVAPGMQMQVAEKGLTDVELVVDQVEADFCLTRPYNPSTVLKIGMRIQQLP